MRILLINPKTEGYSRSVTLPLGLLSIAGVLQKDGHAVRLYKTPHRHLITGNSATNVAVGMYRNRGRYRTFR